MHNPPRTKNFRAEAKRVRVDEHLHCISRSMRPSFRSHRPAGRESVNRNRHWSFRFSEQTSPIKHIWRSLASRVGVILGCMELSRPPLVVAFALSKRRKAIVADALAGVSAVIYLTELDGAARAEALRNAGALLTHNTVKDLRSGEAALLHSARLIQFTIAGVDFIPLGELPEGVPVATNGGGHAEPMAEHALAYR